MQLLHARAPPSPGLNLLVAGLRSFARDGRLWCHRSAIPRGYVSPYVGTPRGPMFRNSVGVGPPARAVILREFPYFT
jgi:hypothetical protein